MYCAPCWHTYFDRKVRDDPDGARNVRKYAHARCAGAVQGGSEAEAAAARQQELPGGET
eukprot:CAMPEP_0179362120 /NCGR_PEP_ID=MMETSP0797-20121207/80851_1 /TAXON_ID=47934 /ORGANISM="Dinophysis acuminata, Strain DAEP01" /LENGTH=58 /DNA_ID=CAMNT_0021077541 /DNA_START=8 /DNA_END=185 /DNA_ORIENTATION=-